MNWRPDIGNVSSGAITKPMLQSHYSPRWASLFLLLPCIVDPVYLVIAEIEIRAVIITWSKQSAWSEIRDGEIGKEKEVRSSVQSVTCGGGNWGSMLDHDQRILRVKSQQSPFVLQGLDAPSHRHLR